MVAVMEITFKQGANGSTDDTWLALLIVDSLPTQILTVHVYVIHSLWILESPSLI